MRCASPIMVLLQKLKFCQREPKHCQESWPTSVDETTTAMPTSQRDGGLPLGSQSQAAVQGFAGFREVVPGDSALWGCAHLPQHREMSAVHGGDGHLRLYKYHYPDRRPVPSLPPTACCFSGVHCQAATAEGSDGKATGLLSRENEPSVGTFCGSFPVHTLPSSQECQLRINSSARHLSWRGQAAAERS